jgi:hypothetical protein
VRSLWPLVESAFQGIDEHVEARFFQFGDLQVVISRAPARGTVRRESAQRLTLEVWPAMGPRVLVVDWIGRRPHIVHRRHGAWLQRLIRNSRQSK